MKQQQAASGISDAPSTAGAGSAAAGGSGEVAGSTNPGGAAFTSDHLHRGGYQALELIRITNITPLLWVRVDPHGLYNGRLNIFQQGASYYQYSINKFQNERLPNVAPALFCQQMRVWLSNCSMMGMPWVR